METENKKPEWVAKGIGKDIYIREGERGEVVCEIPCHDLEDDRIKAKQRANFIATACNNHYALLEALEGIDKILSLWDNTSVSINKCKELAKNALSKVSS